MKHSKQCMVTVALILAIGGFLLGFDATVISGTVPFVINFFDLTGVRGDLQLGWTAFLSYRLPISATLTFVMCVLRNQPQTAVILAGLPVAQK